ncbi:hypothetical protein BaRGS_00012088 [Batillaria attramentaria]|uniref:Uncharacterized protein n=1 Tax=Batillaria attramentaria TaxID=370345 RepID=A0ABD0LC43_9CAEN
MSSCALVRNVNFTSSKTLYKLVLMGENVVKENGLQWLNSIVPVAKVSESKAAPGNHYARSIKLGCRQSVSSPSRQALKTFLSGPISDGCPFLGVFNGLRKRYVGT